MTTKKIGLTCKVAFTKLYSFVGFKLCGVEVSENVLVQLKRKSGKCKCPRCKKQAKPIESYLRKVRDLDVAGKNCYIEFVEFHIKCSCGFYGVEDLDFIERYSRHTARFSDYVAKLCDKMSLTDVSKVAKIDWKTAKEIDKSNLKKLVIDLQSVSPEGIGIDEIAHEKGHKYLTVVRDLCGGVIWIGNGRKTETLDLFFKELGTEKSKKIVIATMDMWDPYIKSVKENTNAKIVFDKFHISKIINSALDKIRKQEFAIADEEERKQMKKKRFLILSRKKNLSNEKKETLDELMSNNEKLYQAYLLKEQILDILDEENELIARERFVNWFVNIINSRISQFQKVMKTIENYFYGIMNYFIYKVTNAGSEGYNTKINVIKRRAYGFRDIEYFKLKILQSCI